MDYKRKIDFAIKLLRSIPQDGPVELSYSGGKDSDVILRLARMSGIKFRAIYKNTTIDPPGTIKHCKDNRIEILNPKHTFLELVAKKGRPTRFTRHCCSELKEYKVLDRAIQGIRREESAKRAKRYKEPEFCRLYGKKEKVRVYLPILEWTKEDVARFVEEEGIQCHPLYYDRGGQFCPERRLGCIGCPMQSDNGIGAYLQYPKLLKQIVKAQNRFLETHPATKSAQKFKSGYDAIYMQLFCESYEQYQERVTGGLFPDMAIDPEKFIKEYFKID